ncbi:hypothetical protein [Acetoanaerobium noterae]|uniref:hypothetical protein n=1 Tax=Acetoanaerobium noterae TaxID=745369 RepID=UPI0033421D20
MEVCQVHEMTLKNFQQFHDNQKDIVKSINTINERMVAVEQSTKSAHHRLDFQDEQTKAILDISGNIKYMAKQVEETVGILKEHDGRLDKLEKAPGDALIAYWKLFLGAIITGSAGLIVGLVLK